MPATTVISRVKGDFFALLIPGAFIMVLAVSGVLAVGGFRIDVTINMETFLKVMDMNWMILILVGFTISYLVGIVLRAIPVKWSDWISGKIFFWMAVSDWEKLSYKRPFPYLPNLKMIRDELIEAKLIAGFDIPEEGLLHNAYNYWKIYICSRSEELFAYIQNLESNVRLFVGMFWAGLTGFLGYGFLWFRCQSDPSMGAGWKNYFIVMFVISVIIIIMFGMNIRRVRVMEAGASFLSFLVLLQEKVSEAESKETEKKKPGPNPSLELLSNLFGRKS